jgi:surface polysaccharide O-acyltransferase-like enzyme
LSNELPQKRIASIDFFRAIAVFAVVANHSHPFREISWTLNEALNQATAFAVPFFFIIAGYLFTLKLEHSHWSPSVFPVYIKRLILVFVSWSVIYFLLPVTLPASQVRQSGLARAYKDHIFDRIEWIADNKLDFATQGMSFHLWFLVSLMFGIAIVYFFIRLGAPEKVFYLAVPLYVFGFLARYYVDTPLGIHVDFNARNGPFVSTLFVALGMLLARKHYQPTLRVALIALFGGFALQMVESLTLIQLYGRPFPGPDYIIGTVPYALGFVFLALARPALGKNTLITGWGFYTLGIYTTHMLSIRLLDRFLVDVPGVLLEIIMPFLAFFLSLAAAYLLAKNSYMRRIVI